jgi:sortase A
MRHVHKLEIVLIAIGVCAAAFATAPSIRARLAQRGAVHAMAQAQAQSSQAAAGDSAIIPEATLASTYPSSSPEDDGLSHVIGVIRMPSLSIDAPLVSGISSNALSRGVGHVPGSAYAGGLGNMVLAGHRDTFFRPLRSVEPGMDVIVDSTNGRYLYRVDRSEVVTPDDLKVLDIGQRPELTLITCYPFNFLGSAPKRFIVHAHLVSVVPETLPR